MNPSAKLNICLFSDANFLALNILENLLSRNCVINVVTKDVAAWQERTNHLSGRNKFSIIDWELFNPDAVYEYAIFCGGFISLKETYSDYEKFTSLHKSDTVKTLILLPFESFDRGRVDKIGLNGNRAVLFVGDLIGPRIDLGSDLLVSRCLAEIVQKRKLTLPVGEVFYPLFVADVARQVAKWLFSFGPYGKDIFLLGNQVSGDVFWNANQKLLVDLKLSYDPKISNRHIPKGFEIQTLNSNLGFALGETYTWLRNNWASYTGSNKKGSGGGALKEHYHPVVSKRLKISFVVLTIIFIFPFLTLGISLFTSFFAYKSFVAGKDTRAGDLLMLASTFALVSRKESSVLRYIPLLGLVYRENKFAASFIERSEKAGIHMIPIIRNSTSLSENVLGNQVYDPEVLLGKLAPDVSNLYDDIVSIKSLTEVSAKSGVVLASKLLARVDFEKYVNLVSKGETIINNASGVLGKDGSKTYLVLFQNNTELRPTGGFIGSFGLATFDSGRLSDLTINDVYSADGQLNGHVEPPAPIKAYLGEANWWLRDSNWDPDFPTSAKRAEWFLDKELGKEVDGVLALDLFPIREILKSTGPIFLSDYNLDITSENLYEKTQSEVQENFFPGTHKKASFLTALSRNLLTAVTKLDTKQKLGVLVSLYRSLDQRRVQMYLHNDNFQEAVSSLGWDGSVVLPACGADCYGDLVGIVEANVGVNKANFFVKRKISLEVNVNAYQIDRKLTLDLTNSANPALGLAGRYKTYVRVLVPSDASNILIKGLAGQGVQEFLPEITQSKDHQEIGTLIEVLGGDAKSIEFSWTSKLTSNLPLVNYGLYLRKQAGTENDPVSINISGSSVPLGVDPRFSLTKTGSYLYNTTLARDLFSRFSW